MERRHPIGMPNQSRHRIVDGTCMPRGLGLRRLDAAFPPTVVCHRDLLRTIFTIHTVLEVASQGGVKPPQSKGCATLPPPFCASAWPRLNHIGTPAFRI